MREARRAPGGGRAGWCLLLGLGWGSRGCGRGGAGWSGAGVMFGVFFFLGRCRTFGEARDVADRGGGDTGIVGARWLGAWVLRFYSGCGRVEARLILRIRSRTRNRPRGPDPIPNPVPNPTPVAMAELRDPSFEIRGRKTEGRGSRRTSVLLGFGLRSSVVRSSGLGIGSRQPVSGLGIGPRKPQSGSGSGSGSQSGSVTQSGSRFRQCQLIGLFVWQ